MPSSSNNFCAVIILFEREKQNIAKDSKVIPELISVPGGYFSVSRYPSKGNVGS